MFSELEKKLLDNPSTQFPLLAAVSAASKRCPTCGHPKADVHIMLRAAIIKYRNDKDFIRHCSSLFPLPASIAGIMISKEH